jgi:cytochrome bd ubiquinol oxidase subunit I
LHALDLARWQFGIITVYHFLFVPLTIGLSLLVAGMETAWYRTRDPKYKTMTKFWGKLFLINFAMGVVTGIVQEFQFGMNWSDYSRFVGDIFGAPLAIEGLLAFFLESTFLGLWIFGWDRLSPRLHLASIWMVAVGTLCSAYFILAANSWMQHPTGWAMSTDPARPRAVLHDFGAVLLNSTLLVTFPHTLTACLMTAGVFLIAISAWHLGRQQHVEVMRPSMMLGLVVTLVASLGIVLTGDAQAKVMTAQQPMKMAAAEALYHTEQPASFSLFTIGSLDGSKERFSVRVPRVLSFMATGSVRGKVEGINDIQRAEAAKYGPGDYRPDVPVTYWGFRLMMGFGFIAALVALAGLWLFRRGRTPTGRRFYTIGLLTLVTPYLANSFGWIFTEMGRQPWSVFGVLRTADGVSPRVSAGEVATSLIVLTVLYGGLAAVEVVVLLRYIKAGPQPEPESAADSEDPEHPLVFAY